MLKQDYQSLNDQGEVSKSFQWKKILMFTLIAASICAFFFFHKEIGLMEDEVGQTKPMCKDLQWFADEVHALSASVSDQTAHQCTDAFADFVDAVPLNKIGCNCALQLDGKVDESQDCNLIVKEDFTFTLLDGISYCKNPDDLELETSIGGGGIPCFEAHDRTIEYTKGEIELKRLEVGDYVQTCDGDWTRIWVILHSEEEIISPNFYKIELENTDISLTDDHYLPICDANSNIIDHKLSKNVQIGDLVCVEDGNIEVVQNIQRLEGQIFFPITSKMHYLVNGICATYMVNGFESIFAIETVFGQDVWKYIMGAEDMIPDAYFKYFMKPIGIWMYNHGIYHAGPLHNTQIGSLLLALFAFTNGAAWLSFYTYIFCIFIPRIVRALIVAKSRKE